MIDPVNPQNKVVVVKEIAKKDVGVYHNSHDVCTFAYHFQNLIPLYQPALAK